MKKVLHARNKILCFKRWSRKKYAVFNSINNVVVISTLAADITTTLLPKTKKTIKKMSLITDLEARVVGGGSITPEEALLLSGVGDKEALYEAANRIREHFHARNFDLCSIVNARSGRCSEDCKWCSQSSYHKTEIDIYDLIEHDKAVSQAKINQTAGVKKFSLVTSGRTISSRNLTSLCRIYDTLKEDTSLELCASMGLLSKEKLQQLYDSGVRNYHCNIETAPSFFPRLCTTHTFEEKKETLFAAREVGMKLCSGGIIGMGETMVQRIEMAFTLQEMEVESIPLNILNPIKGTRLENAPPLSDEEILITFALFRFINPKSLIRFAGGRTRILHVQDKAIRTGINGALVGDLLTTVGVGMNEDISYFRSEGFVC